MDGCAAKFFSLYVTLTSVHRHIHISQFSPWTLIHLATSLLRWSTHADPTGVPPPTSPLLSSPILSIHNILFPLAQCTYACSLRSDLPIYTRKCRGTATRSYNVHIHLELCNLHEGGQQHRIPTSFVCERIAIEQAEKRSV